MVSLFYYYSEQTCTILIEIHGVPTRGSVGGLRVEGSDGVARGLDGLSVVLV